MRSRTEDEERTFDHGAAVMTSLTKALDALDVSQLRRRAFINYLMAEQMIMEGQFEQALTTFRSINDFLCKDNWTECAVSVLRKMLLCSLALGRSTTYLQTVINLFALDSASHLTVYEKDELHRDIMSIVMSTATTAQLATGAFYCKSDFAVASHTSEAMIEYSLPNNYSVELSDANYSKMFDVKAKFESSTVEVGHSVRVNLVVTNLFHGHLTFSEMAVCFTGDCLVRKFVHDGSGSGDSDGGILEGEEDLIRANSHLFMALDGESCVKKERRPSISAVVANSYLSPTKASLVFPSKKSVTFSFLLFVPENSFNNGNLAMDPSIFVEKLVLTISSPVRSPNPSPVPNDDGQLENATPSVSSDGCKRITFVVSALSRTFVTRREGYGKTMQLKDFVLFLPLNDCPALLQIEKLAALVEMVRPKPLPAPVSTPIALSLNSPISSLVSSSTSASAIAPTISLLQGPIQRVDVVFRSNANAVINGKLYLSSDFVSVSGGHQQNLFWFPDLLTVKEEDCDKYPAVDAIRFHPFRLNASFQPTQPILIPNHLEQDSLFCVPLFVKSEIHATVTVKLLMEYVPKKRLSTSVTKDFEFKISFAKPLQMNFTMSSWKENLCGVPRDSNMPTVLAGDVLNMTASLSCINSLSSTIDVLSMLLQSNVPGNRAGDGSVTTVSGGDKSGDKRDFKYLECKNPRRYSFIPSEYSQEGPGAGDDNDTVISLGLNEIFLGNVDVECVYATNETVSSPTQSLRMGHTVMENYSGTNVNSQNSTVSSHQSQPGDVFVAWRLVDSKFMLPSAVDELVPSSSNVPTPSKMEMLKRKNELFNRLLPAADAPESPADGLSEAVSQALSPDENGDTFRANDQFKWLYKPLGLGKRTVSAGVSDGSTSGMNGMDGALDTSVTSTRVCEMMFSVPVVSVRDLQKLLLIVSEDNCLCRRLLMHRSMCHSFVLPHARWESVSICLLISVQKYGPWKGWLCSCCSMKISSSQGLPPVRSRSGFVGFTSQTLRNVSLLQVGPRSEASVSFAFAPLKCGQVNLPQVSVTWERSGISLIDLGVGRYFFVYP
jgi:hypothetical protein